LLTKEGYQVTQATLSRDLALLRAVRIQGEDGLRYELQEGLDSRGAQVLPELAEMVVSIEENGTLVVVLTQPGSAPALARAIDVARLPDVLGSLAGDDTIFLAPQKRSSAIQLAQKLRRLFGRVET
jgi:transcriptional regulator of arginine metabolism